MTSAIVASGISKAFGEVQALDDLNLDVPEGAFFVLLKLGVIVREASRPTIQDYGDYSLDQGREVRPEEERR